MAAFKIVVVGSGAREHALVRALLRGGGDREVVCIPGNPGIAREAQCRPAPAGFAAAAIAEKPDLVVVGPEAPLADGLADELAEKGIPCFGPSKRAAQIEASKAFAKEVMRAAKVPTAESAVFDDPARAKAHVSRECVVKLDGLAAGKGVIVCDDASQARSAIDELYKPGARLLIEERLTGRELSVIALCDGEYLVPLPTARDHKRLLDGDQGPNTGGMGAVCSPADSTQAIVDETMRTVLEPTAREMARRGTPFVGALYAGLMLTPRGIRVLEFNCRLGDPEAQAILIRLRSDPLPLFHEAAIKKLHGAKPGWDERISVAVVAAAANYPATPRSGDRIDGLDGAGEGEDLWVLHAGTKLDGGKVVTGGGRVLTFAALGKDVAAARERAYRAVERVHFDGMQVRRDIALP
jgi:phosphoribosylamine--glycine ligase